MAFEIEDTLSSKTDQIDLEKQIRKDYLATDTDHMRRSQTQPDWSDALLFLFATQPMMLTLVVVSGLIILAYFDP